MRALVLLILALNITYAAPHDVRMMLDKAKDAFGTQQTVNFERETRFLDNLNEQKRLLQEAKDEVARLKKQSVQLNDTIDNNEKKLAKLEEKLQARSGNLGELYGVVRQSAGDMHAQFQASATSVANAKRLDFLKELSQTKKLPNIDKLSHFWYLMLEELTLQGQNRKKSLQVINTNGDKQTQVVQTAGVFNAVSTQGFLEYLPQSNIFLVLEKQPSSSLVDVALEGFSVDEGLYETILDPTRGELLKLSTKSPTISERIDQGSTIGYLILIIGALGLLYALYIGVRLAVIARRMNQKSPASFSSRIQASYDESKHLSLEHIELSLQEQLTRFKQQTQKGLALIKLLAAVAPLMGLLGTVTGMIATFSAITLFGTGDPKLMAGGISQALITTVEGLVVAIPMLFAHTLLASKAKAINEDLDAQSLKLLAKHEES